MTGWSLGIPEKFMKESLDRFLKKKSWWSLWSNVCCYTQKNIGCIREGFWNLFYGEEVKEPINTFFGKYLKEFLIELFDFFGNIHIFNSQKKNIKNFHSNMFGRIFWKKSLNINSTIPVWFLFDSCWVPFLF